MNETPEQTEPAAEIVAYQHPQRTVDLRNKTTDSWTDVARETFVLAERLHSTEFVPKGLRGSMEKTAAALFYGREIGLPPMTGLAAISMIEGKPSVSAEMQRALILQAGHELVVVESTRERCEIKGRRRGQEEWTTAVWTIGEANQTKVYLSQAKGWGPLSSKSQWQSWPAEMLLARASTRLARMIFPDVIHGMRSVEELTDMLADEDAPAAPHAAPVAPEPVKRKRVTPKTRKADNKPVSTSDVALDKETGEITEPTPEPEPARQPVQRTRKTVPAKKTTPPPPEPEPEPVEAEIVDEQPPMEEPPPEDPAIVEAEVINDWNEQQPKITEPQLKKLVVQFNQLGMTEKPERIWATSELIGRPVDSAKHLTRTEASRLIDQLERCKTRGDVEILIERQAEE